MCHHPLVLSKQANKNVLYIANIYCINEIKFITLHAAYTAYLS